MPLGVAIVRNWPPYGPSLRRPKTQRKISRSPRSTATLKSVSLILLTLKKYSNYLVSQQFALITRSLASPAWNCEFLSYPSHLSSSALPPPPRVLRNIFLIMFFPIGKVSMMVSSMIMRDHKLLLSWANSLAASLRTPLPSRIPNRLSSCWPKTTSTGKYWRRMARGWSTCEYLSPPQHNTLTQKKAMPLGVVIVKKWHPLGRTLLPPPDQMGRPSTWPKLIAMPTLPYATASTSTPSLPSNCK